MRNRDKALMTIGIGIGIGIAISIAITMATACLNSEIRFAILPILTH
jgi:hypothetical protein